MKKKKFNGRNLLVVIMLVFASIGFPQFSGTTLAAAPWGNAVSGTTDDLVNVYYGNGLFVAVGNAGTILTSSDGITWDKKTLSGGDDLSAVVYSEGKWVIGGANGVIYTSTDPTIVSSWQLAETDGVSSIIWNITVGGNGTLVAVAENGEILYSTDGGEIWHNDFTNAFGFYGVHYGTAKGKSRYVAVGQTAEIQTSDDGVGGWEWRDAGAGVNLYSITSGNDLFVAVGDTTLLTSPDGIDWSSLTWPTEAPTGNLYSVAYAGNKFIAVGENGTVLTSLDGKTWDYESAGTIGYLLGVAGGHDRYVAVGEGGMIKTQPMSSNANLSDLKLDGGTPYAPAFSSATTSYTWSVTSDVDTVQVTPFLQDSFATVTINGKQGFDGMNKSVSLNQGLNQITIVVTAQNGTSKTYTLDITRGSTVSNNANLSNLTVSAGTLAPSFTADQTEYTASVANGITSVDVTAMAADSSATVEVTEAVNGHVALIVGENMIHVQVKAQDSTPKTYTIKVTREASSNANLSNLTLSEGTLAPSFTADQTEYTASVANGVTSVDVTAIADSSATVEVTEAVNGHVPLIVGENVIHVQVTAQDSTPKTYTVKVTRAEAPTMNSTISTAMARFDKKITAQADIATTMTLNGNILSSIQNGAANLVLNTDYTVSGNDVTINKAYLATQAVGTTVLTFNFSAGSAQTLTISITETIDPDTTLPEAPTINLNPNSWTNGSVTATIYGEPGATIEYRLSPTASWHVYTTPVVLNEEGEYSIYARQTDASINISGTNSAIIRIDKTKPVIQLIGDESVSVYYQGEFTDPGVLVTDNLTQNPQATVTGNVNTGVVGSYQIFYQVVDAAGNAADQKVRTVHVIAKPKGLRFDQATYTVKEKGSMPFHLHMNFDGGDDQDVTLLGNYSFAPIGIASASVDGTIQGIKAGQTVLTAVYDNRSISVPINVQAETLDVYDAAQQVQIGYDAGDTWESVTQNVVLPTIGKNDTIVTWLSSDPDVISNIGRVTRPTTGDKTIYMLATVKKEQLVAKKTFLVIVKKSSLSVVSEESTRTVPVRVGETQNDVEQTTIVRKTLSDGTKIDKVTLEADKAQAAISEAIAQNQTLVRVVVNDIPTDRANEVAVEVSSSAYKNMASKLDLAIETDEATVLLPKDTLQLLEQANVELFFRFVPIRDAELANQVKQQAQMDAKVAEQSVNKTVSQIGTPMEIETNVTSDSPKETKLVFPLAKLNPPSNTLEREAYFANLYIFIEHSDGTTEFKKGTVERDTGGNIIGLSVLINKFSTFTVLKLDEINNTSNGNSGHVTTAPEITQTVPTTEDIENVTVKPYINGFEDSLFLPERQTSRAEFAAMLWRIMLSEGSGQAIATGKNSYEDVSASHWAFEAIEGLRLKGIMTGVTKNEFQPERPVTRAELATLAVRSKVLKDTEISGNASFPDIQGHWAEESIKLLAAQEIVRGYDDGGFHPNDGVTRAEAVTILNRLMKRVLPEIANPKATWRDVNSSHWAFKDIEAASRVYTIESTK
ncbi:cadherin-like beta sandwich domain-containing protein [Paenibacillus sp. GCM10023248]|uniref:cadherin-like beta sandwich domain-containing protein n=1 Tax=unclassified Paenibacillus TaxID=185978 RepID=UPI002378895D|nr:cadherin-like beta sandwich domain-containing protein [Paenibacillus sp. MAHUQ-63]MDD9268630.1 cadherin-like beta sandwich domain-containing protein [Paenibacillus sp. MAHUQ-63]